MRLNPRAVVVGGGVEPNGDGAGAVAVGELVVVVPAVAAALVLGPVGADAAEFGEREVAGVGAFGEAERPGVGVEVEGAAGAVGEGDGLVFDVGALLDASAAGAPVGFGGGDGGGDPVDGEEAEFAEQVLVVGAAQGGVVDDALGAGDEGCEAGEEVEGGAGFAAGGGDPVDVEDDAAVAVVAAYGGEDEFGAPGGVAVAFEMQAGVGFVTQRGDLAGGAVDALVAGLGPIQRGDDFAVGVEQSGRVGMGPGAGPVGVEEPEFSGLLGGDACGGGRRAARGCAGWVR